MWILTIEKTGLSLCTEFLHATAWNTEGLGQWFAHSAQAHTEREKAEVKEEVEWGGGVTRNKNFILQKC